MSSRRSRGFTLVEMIIAMVIIGVGLAGVLMAFSTTVRSSADPLIRKQMLAVAEEMMEEILLKPFDETATGEPANVPVSCGAAGAVRTAFDEVSDYHNYETSGICDIDGDAVTDLGAYSVRVTVVANAAVATDLTGLPIGTVKTMTVVVTHSSGETLSLVGWRTNYAAP